MMKRLIASLALLLILAACEDALVEDPPALLVESFYNTPQEVEAGIAAIMAPLRGYYPSWFMSALDSQSPFGAVGQPTGNWSFRGMAGLDGTGISRTEGAWDNHYQAIRNANLVIRYVPESEELTEEEKDLYLAEARTMRAFMYFQLVKIYGGVPIYTPDNMDETTGAPRSSVEDVYELILSDLEWAETRLGSSPRLQGVPSEWVAKTLLSNVYFYNEMYAEARDKAEEVIASGQFSLEPVEEADDFYNLYGEDQSSEERIWDIHYDDANPSTNFLRFVLPIETPYWGTNGYGIFRMPTTQPIYATWDDDDLRKEYGWYHDTSRDFDNPDPRDVWIDGESLLMAPKKFSDPTGSRTSATHDFPLYRYAEVLLIYAEASARAAGAPTSVGVERFNMVHRRAYGYDPTQPSPVDFDESDFDLDSFIERLAIERMYELQFEAKIWHDLVRSGLVYELVERFSNREVQEQHILWPIPPREIETNENISEGDQNPGY